MVAYEANRRSPAYRAAVLNNAADEIGAIFDDARIRVDALGPLLAPRFQHRLIVCILVAETKRDALKNERVFLICIPKFCKLRMLRWQLIKTNGGRRLGSFCIVKHKRVFIRRYRFVTKMQMFAL